MSVADDLKAVRLNAGVGCKVCYYLDVMNTNEADAMRSALEKTKLYSHVDLADVFTVNGMPVTESSVRRHRKSH